MKVSSVFLVIWGGITTVIQFWPDAMLQAWLFLPEDLKASLPPIAVKWITYGIFASAMLSKMYKARQEKKQLKQELDHARLTNTILAVDSGGTGNSGGPAGVRPPEEETGAAGGAGQGSNASS